MDMNKTNNRLSPFLTRTFLWRVLSTAVLAPLVVFLILKGGYWLTALLVAVALLMDVEWSKLTQLSQINRAFLTAGTVGVCWWLLSMREIEGLIDGGAFVVAASLATISLGWCFRRSSWLWLGFGLAYIAVPILAIGLMSLLPHGTLWILWMMATVWACDCAAYLVGSALRGPKLAPTVSPGKTWSGLAGGVLASTAAAAYLGIELDLGSLSGLVMPWSAFAAMGGGVAIAGQLGDLLESAIKRRFGAKDSGALIPGHGGALDRFDSLVFVAPLLAFGLWLTASF